MTPKPFRIIEDLEAPEMSDDGRFHIWVEHARRLAVVAGGDGPNPVANPLDAPTIAGDELTIDILLQEPTRITQYLLDLTLQRFVLDYIFDSAGGVSGGAIVYDQIVANDLYTTQDVQSIAPNGEYPIVGSGRRAPKVAQVEKYGGRFFFSDEARDRNQQSAFRNQTIRLGNTIVRKINTVAIAELETAISGNSGNSNFTGHDWSTAIPTGASPTPPSEAPLADFSHAQVLADQDELGVEFDTALINPAQRDALFLYAAALGTSVEALLAGTPFRTVFASNRIAAGTAYFVASGQVGEMRLEAPLQTVTYREDGNDRTWVQSGVRPVFAVTNPFSVMKATGLAG